LHLKIEELRKRFGSNEVLRGIDLEIQPGELACIVGPSGTGKSVLLKHVVGLIKPDAGKILVDGEDIVPWREKKLLTIRQRFGMIFQNGGLLQSLTLGENVGLPLRERTNQSPAEIRKIVEEKLEIVGLGGKADQSVSTLSGGQVKRAAIARALTTKADCLLFDEPTAGLDPIMAENIDKVIQEVTRETGATSLVVTHDVASVFAIADRIYMLDAGKVVFAGTTDEFRGSDHDKVREFLARDLDNRHANGDAEASRQDEERAAT